MARLPRRTIELLSPYFKNYNLHDIKVHEGIPWYVIGSPDAYASGNNLYFAPGKYNPHTASGLALIGHEALHSQQYKERGTFLFRVSYIAQYVLGRLKGLSHQRAYWNISFEQEAYALQYDIKQAIGSSNEFQ